MIMWQWIVMLLAGYLIGSISASIIISKLKGNDIRNNGSGNAGATNTLRTFGIKTAIVVTIFDVLKGVIAVLIARFIFHDPASEVMAGFGAVLGHNFPLYFGFKGGKGILTSLAVAAVLSPWSALCALVIGVLVIVFSKYVSLGSVTGCVILPLASVYFEFGNWWLISFMIILGALAVIRHSGNIKRLIAGTERKLGEKKDK